MSIGAPDLAGDGAGPATTNVFFASAQAAAPLTLDGNGLTIKSIKLGGRPLSADSFTATPDKLSIPQPPQRKCVPASSVYGWQNPLEGAPSGWSAAHTAMQSIVPASPASDMARQGIVTSYEHTTSLQE